MKKAFNSSCRSRKYGFSNNTDFMKIWFAMNNFLMVLINSCHNFQFYWAILVNLRRTCWNFRFKLQDLEVAWVFPHAPSKPMFLLGSTLGFNQMCTVESDAPGGLMTEIDIFVRRCHHSSLNKFHFHSIEKHEINFCQDNCGIRCWTYGIIYTPWTGTGKSNRSHEDGWYALLTKMFFFDQFRIISGIPLRRTRF